MHNPSIHVASACATLVLAGIAGSAFAQDARDALEPMQEVMVAPDALKWGPAGDDLPKGAQVALILGDPSKAGSIVVARVKLPPHYLIPPHMHDWAETVTLMSGSLGWGMATTVDKSGELAKPGTLFTLPAKHVHYVWTGDDEAIFQIQFIGPGGITYVNPADDPRKK